MILNSRHTFFSKWDVFILCFLLIVYANQCLYGSNEHPVKQNLPCTSTGDLPFITDLNCYRAIEGKTNVEIYYIVRLKDLLFVTRHDSLQTSFSIGLTITDSSSQKIFSKDFINSAYARSPAEIKQESRVVIDQIVHYLAPGNYRFQLQIIDLNSQKIGLCEFSTDIISFDSNTLSMSDIQLASAITIDTSTHKFTKNNRRVVPNPERRFIYSRSHLCLYFEIYNLIPQDADFANTFTLQYLISASNGQTLIEYPPKTILKPGDSCVKVQAIDIRELEIGDYHLQVSIKDNFSNQEISGSKTFTIIEQEQPQLVLSMTEEDIQRYYDQIKYIANNDELELFKQLDERGKENFLINFWRSKDPDPETQENEFMIEHFGRIDYANKHFKGQRGGVKSDMGRVFIVYGQPSDVENHFWDEGVTPYTIWHYEARGGRQQFIFVDRNNDGIYTLVHSTVIGEIKNENWMHFELK